MLFRSVFAVREIAHVGVGAILRASFHRHISAMAELVRVRSIELANSSGQLKFSASHASTLHTTGNQVLQPGVQ